MDAERRDEMIRDETGKRQQNRCLLPVPLRAGERCQPADVQLGKLIDEGPEDYDPWG